MAHRAEADRQRTTSSIDGRCTTLTGLSDFVANLEASGYFKRSIEIVSTRPSRSPQPPGELIKFTIKALFQQPGDANGRGATADAARTAGD